MTLRPLTWSVLALLGACQALLGDERSGESPSETPSPPDTPADAQRGEASAPSDATTAASDGSASEGGADASAPLPDASPAPRTDGAPSEAGPDASVDAPAPASFRILYLVTPSARPTSVQAADQACNASRPAGVSDAKALFVEGETRRACSSPYCASGGATEHRDWPLFANTQYRRADGLTVIGTTNGFGLFDQPLDASVGTVASVYAWTGLRPASSSGTTWETGRNCFGWAPDASSEDGVVGYTEPGYEVNAFGWFLTFCNQVHALYCAQVAP